jgi:hypothetical protein
MAVHFARLTRTAIRRLQPGEKISEHGIVAECLANGDIKYSVGIMVDGTRAHRTIGRQSDGTTRTQCEEFIAKVRTDARAGRLGLPRGRKIPLLFTKATESYIARLEQSGGKNITTKREHFRNHLISFFGAMRLGAITSFALERYKKQRLDAGAAKATINRELATLSHLFTQAVEWGWLDHLPTRIRRLPEDPGRITVLSDEELDRLLQAAVAGADMDLPLFIAVAAATGMRHTEVLRINKSTSTTRPVTVIGPRRRCSVDASRSNAASRISAKPAARAVNAKAASRQPVWRRSAKAKPPPATAATIPAHRGGSTRRKK